MCVCDIGKGKGRICRGKILKEEGKGALDFRTVKDTVIVIWAWNDNHSVTVGPNVHQVELRQKGAK